MPVIEQLTSRQIRQCLDEAVDRQAPVCLTCREGTTWLNLRTRILQAGGQALWLADPFEGVQPPRQILPGTALGLSFKLRHHKHVFTAAAQAVCQVRCEHLGTVQAVQVALPQQMERIQRRAFIRADVPRNRSVLATFWQGGQAMAPDTPQAQPLWEGWVTNLSAGGFQVRLASHAAPPLEAGDVVGVRIDLGQEFPPLLADAQFRHVTQDDRGVTRLGFQFVGLNESAHGRQTLVLIGQVVRQFQHVGARRRGRTVA
jgi:hypothetical protein